MPAWQYLQSGGRHAELIWHRRFGKDEVALHHTACAAHERIGNYWHMLPEYAQARKAIWEAVNPHTGKRRIDEVFPHELRKSTRNDEMKIDLKVGSSWQVLGSDRYDALVGSTPIGVVWSEWALSNPNAAGYLEPIFEENGGWQVFVGTPRGRNHAHKSYLSAKQRKGAFAQILTVHDTKIFSPERLADIRQKNIDRYGEEFGLARYQQEYECSFDAANVGSILALQIGKLEAQDRIGEHVQYDPEGSPIEISADIGRADTATWYFWQPRLGGYAIIDHDSGFGIDADDWCRRIDDKLSEYRAAGGKRALGKIWLPHDARAKTFAAKHSAVEVFIKHFGADKVAITPNGRKSDRINAARKIIQRVEFSDKCAKGIDALRSWAYEWDDDKKMFSSEPKHDWASHDGDGFSYGCLIMSERLPTQPESEILYPIKGVGNRIVTAPLETLWAESRQRKERY